MNGKGCWARLGTWIARAVGQGNGIWERGVKVEAVEAGGAGSAPGLALAA